MRKYLSLWPILSLFLSCHPTPHYDTIIKNGAIYDGTGAKPFTGDIALQDDTIAAIGDLKGATATNIIDATNKAVSPGFIDLQSQSMISLIQDGRSLGAIKQGVTLEIFGEGSSEGCSRAGL